MLMGLWRLLALLWITVIGAGIYLTSSYLRSLARYVMPWLRKRRDLEIELRKAPTYAEWVKIAEKIDRVRGRDLWKLAPQCPRFYDAQGVHLRLEKLRRLMLDDDIDGLIALLRESLSRNICGLGNEGLYRHCTVGTKVIIEEYIQQMCAAINHLSDTDDMWLRDKEAFLINSRQAFGRSALVFSGGLSYGMHHLGVIKCLFEENLLPQIICGSSIGALFAALLGISTDEELADLLNGDTELDFSAFDKLEKTGSFKRKLIRLLTKGVLLNVNTMEEFCRDNLGSYTFEEAYERTGRIINITLTHTTHRGTPHLLNYITTPNVYLWSAAAASCSQPGLYAPVSLKLRGPDGRMVVADQAHVSDSWTPETIHHPQLPATRLGELFNVNHIIVSQVNPPVVPFLRTLHSTSRHAWYHKLLMLGLYEAHHYLRQWAQHGPLPRSMEWFRHDMLQPVQGDITIVPQLYARFIPSIFKNPTAEILKTFKDNGERSVFPYLSMIKSHCQIEICLQSALHRVKQQMLLNRTQLDATDEEYDEEEEEEEEEDEEHGAEVVGEVDPLIRGTREQGSMSEDLSKVQQRRSQTSRTKPRQRGKFSIRQLRSQHLSQHSTESQFSGESGSEHDDDDSDGTIRPPPRSPRAASLPNEKSDGFFQESSDEASPAGRENTNSDTRAFSVGGGVERKEPHSSVLRSRKHLRDRRLGSDLEPFDSLFTPVPMPNQPPISHAPSHSHSRQHRHPHHKHSKRAQREHGTSPSTTNSDSMSSANSSASSRHNSANCRPTRPAEQATLVGEDFASSNGDDASGADVTRSENDEASSGGLSNQDRRRQYRHHKRIAHANAPYSPSHATPRAHGSTSMGKAHQSSTASLLQGSPMADWRIPERVTRTPPYTPPYTPPRSPSFARKHAQHQHESHHQGDRLGLSSSGERSADSLSSGNLPDVMAPQYQARVNRQGHRGQLQHAGRATKGVVGSSPSMHDTSVTSTRVSSLSRSDKGGIDLAIVNERLRMEGSSSNSSNRSRHGEWDCKTSQAYLASDEIDDVE